MSTIQKGARFGYNLGLFGLNQLQQRLREPVNALTHLAGAFLAFFGLLLLVYLTWNDRPKMVVLAIYGLTMVVLFAISSLFHGLKVADEKRRWLNRLDHMAIFLLIAGTYTPIVYLLFPHPIGLLTLAAIWLIALSGMIYKLLGRRIHGLINVSLYPVLGWAGILPALIISRTQPLVPRGGLLLLLAGGLIYMIGFVIYYRRKPDPWPPIFGHHEIWHLFVMGGSFCHFLFMLLYIVPASSLV
jgi:hemolysin III